MITITVDTQDEYDEMMEYAEQYMCRNITDDTCIGFGPNRCKDCFEQFHDKYGIRLIYSTVDNTNPDKL